MKHIITITAILTVITVAVTGCLYIFEIISADTAISNLSKIVAVIVLLGGCSALVAVITRSRK